MDNIASSFSEALKKRATSATLGTYLFFWSAYHWQGLYATFFVDQKLVLAKYGLLKNEYVNKYFFGYHDTLDWHFIWGVVLPGILTYIFIFLIPRKVIVRFYKQEQGYKVDKRIIKLEEEERIALKQEKFAKQVEKTVIAEIAATNKKQEAAHIDPTIFWEEEVEAIKIKNNPELQDIFSCVYEYNGNVQVESEYPGNPPDFELDPNSLKFGDSHGLLNIVDTGKRIELTNKGKYFASKFDERL